MKLRILTMLATLLAFANAAFASCDHPVTYDKLPLAAREFIEQNFPGENLLYAKVDNDVFEVTYETVFNGGLKIDFNGKGEWKQIENKYVPLDPKFIPAQIQEFVGRSYPGALFLKIEKGRWKYEVDLTNGLELTFDQNFNLIDIDD